MQDNKKQSHEDTAAEDIIKLLTQAKLSYSQIMYILYEVIEKIQKLPVKKNI